MEANSIIWLEQSAHVELVGSSLILLRISSAVDEDTINYNYSFHLFLIISTKQMNVKSKLI